MFTGETMPATRSTGPAELTPIPATPSRPTGAAAAVTSARNPSVNASGVPVIARVGTRSLDTMAPWLSTSAAAIFVAPMSSATATDVKDDSPEIAGGTRPAYGFVPPSPVHGQQEPL